MEKTGGHTETDEETAAGLTRGPLTCPALLYPVAHPSLAQSCLSLPCTLNPPILTPALHPSLNHSLNTNHNDTHCKIINYSIDDNNNNDNNNNKKKKKKKKKIINWNYYNCSISFTCSLWWLELVLFGEQQQDRSCSSGPLN